eukprot:745223-Pelagomonas_calceolata.AAC.2
MVATFGGLLTLQDSCSRLVLKCNNCNSFEIQLARNRDQVLPLICRPPPKEQEELAVPVAGHPGLLPSPELRAA